MATDIYLTIAQLNSIFWTATVQMLGLDPTATATQSSVRQSWATDGAPAWEIDETITFIKVLPADDDYNKIRDMTWTEIDDATMNQAMSYTRCLEIYWTIYGPNSEDVSQTIRDQLFYDTIHDLLAINNLYMITEIEEPVRSPELFEKRWWERVDMHVKFNELITRNITISSVAEVPITVMTGTTDPQPTTNTTIPSTPIPGEPTTVEDVNINILLG